MKKLIRSLSIFCTAILILTPTFADDSVSFFVVGKTPLYEQSVDGKLHYKNHYLFGEIFLTDGGDLKSATLLPPDGSKHQQLPFTKAGHVWKIVRQDFDTLEQLDATFPDGDYQFVFETASGARYRETVSLKSTTADREFSRPIDIYFYQHGHYVAQTDIDPNYDLVIRWSAFTKGRKDPSGISDDLVFVISSDCNGKSFARTALPFEPIPALSYSDREFRIPADRLEAGSNYNLLVEHAELVDTSKNDAGIVGLATFPTVTKTIFKTMGKANPECRSAQ